MMASESFASSAKSSPPSGVTATDTAPLPSFTVLVTSSVRRSTNVTPKLPPRYPVPPSALTATVVTPLPTFTILVTWSNVALARWASTSASVESPAQATSTCGPTLLTAISTGWLPMFASVATTELQLAESGSASITLTLLEPLLAT